MKVAVTYDFATPPSGGDFVDTISMLFLTTYQNV